MSIALRRICPVSLAHIDAMAAAGRPIDFAAAGWYEGIRSPGWLYSYVRTLPTTRRPWRGVCLRSYIHPSASLHRGVDLLVPSPSLIGALPRSSLLASALSLLPFRLSNVHVSSIPATGCLYDCCAVDPSSIFRLLRENRMAVSTSSHTPAPVIVISPISTTIFDLRTLPPWP